MRMEMSRWLTMKLGYSHINLNSNAKTANGQRTLLWGQWKRSTIKSRSFRSFNMLLWLLRWCFGLLYKGKGDREGIVIFAFSRTFCTYFTSCIEVLNFQLVKFMTMLLRVFTRYQNNEIICKIWARAHIYCYLYVSIWYYMYTCRYVYFCMYFVWRTDF